MTTRELLEVLEPISLFYNDENYTLARASIEEYLKNNALDIPNREYIQRNLDLVIRSYTTENMSNHLRTQVYQKGVAGVSMKLRVFISEENENGDNNFMKLN